MALLTNSLHCERQPTAASGRESKASLDSPSFHGEVKVPAAGLELLNSNHLAELHLLKNHHAQPGEDGVKEALSSWSGAAAAADVAALGKASEGLWVCLLLPLSVMSFSTAGGGLYSSCALQAQLPGVGIATLKASTVLLRCYTKNPLQEGQPLLNTCISTDMF